VIRLFLIVVAFSVLPAVGVADDEITAKEILSRVQTPTNVAIPFVERRKNQLLKEPLVLSGEIDFSAGDSLTKRITSPFSERVTISRTAVEIERDGQTRRLSLKRKKGLTEFYEGLKALFGKDVETLMTLFDVESVSAGDAWEIVLIPANSNLEKSLERMTIGGYKSRVTLIRTVQSPETWQELSFQTPESG
jgi:hypothetical protein